jgi:flagellar export protein FliJ
MAFQFRFQTLLRYRDHLRTRAQMDLAIAVRNQEAAHNFLEEVRSERLQQHQLLEEQCSAGISCSAYQLGVDYIGSLERQLLALEEEFQELSQAVSKAKETVLQRQTEVKMLECLEAEDRANYRKEQRKRELIQLNEKAVIGNSRQELDR